MANIPSLRGQFDMVNMTKDPATHSCRGVWALSDAAHKNPNMTSDFAFSLQVSTDGSMVDKYFPISGKYKGWFDLKQVKGPPAKYDDVIQITFSPHSDGSSGYNISGSGFNQFGRFHVKGDMTEDGKVVMYRMYQVVPKAVKREVSNRARKPPVHHDQIDTFTATREKRTPQPLIKCADILKELSRMPNAVWFTEPVDFVKLGIPDYPTIITQPMCFDNIKANLEAGQYAEPEEFAEHVRLTFSNATKYNSDPHNPVHVAAKEMDAKFLDKYRAQILGIVAHMPASSSSSVPKKNRKSEGGSGSKSGAAGGSSSSSSSKSKSKSIKLENATKAQRMRLAELESEQRRLNKLRELAGLDTSESPRKLKVLTYEEKAALVAKIRNLSSAKEAQVVEIVRSAVPPGKNVRETEHEVLVAVDDIDNYTLHRLIRLVNGPGTKKRQRY